MGKIIAIVVIAAIAWFAYTQVDFDKVGKNTVETLKKEKTINAVNSKRAQDQTDIDTVTDRK